jgi:hypothetical protein
LQSNVLEAISAPGVASCHQRFLYLKLVPTALINEVQRRKHAELGALSTGIIAPRLQTEDVKKAPLQTLIDRYLDQIQTLKKPNTFRKCDAVLKRFTKDFVGQTLDTISVEDLNDFVVKLKKSGMSMSSPQRD